MSAYAAGSESYRKETTEGKQQKKKKKRGAE